MSHSLFGAEKSGDSLQTAGPRGGMKRRTGGAQGWDGAEKMRRKTGDETEEKQRGVRGLGRAGPGRPLLATESCSDWPIIRNEND